MAINNITNPAAAASAYANTSKVAEGPGMNADQGVSFGSMLKDATVDAIHTMHQGEKASAQAITGKANLTDVVQAATAAELTMNTVVAFRDKMLAAYQDIMRMPI